VPSALAQYLHNLYSHHHQNGQGKAIPECAPKTKPRLLEVAHSLQGLPIDFQSYTLDTTVSQEIPKGDFTTLDISSPGTQKFIRQHRLLSSVLDSLYCTEAVRKLTDVFVDSKTAPQQAPPAKLSVREGTTQPIFLQPNAGVAAPPLESIIRKACPKQAKKRQQNH
jgi:hypothetical protein